MCRSSWESSASKTGKIDDFVFAFGSLNGSLFDLANTGILSGFTTGGGVGLAIELIAGLKTSFLCFIMAKIKVSRSFKSKAVFSSKSECSLIIIIFSTNLKRLKSYEQLFQFLGSLSFQPSHSFSVVKLSLTLIVD